MAEPESLNETLQRLGWAEDQAENFIEKAGGTPDEVPESDSVLYHVRVARHWLKQAIEEHDVGLLTAASDAPGLFAPPNEVAAGNFPNEPDGHTAVVRYDGSFKPPHWKTAHGGADDPPVCDDPSMSAGCLIANMSFADGPSHVISDPTAPVGPDQLRFVFAQGENGSPGYVNFWGRQHDQLTAIGRSKTRPNGFELEKMYYSARFRLTSEHADGKWEITTSDGSHCKVLGYISVGARKSSIYPMRIDVTDNEFVTSTGAQLTQQAPASVPLEDKMRFVDTGTIVVDQWHHVEFVLELNDIGSKNGLFVAYMDGVEQSRVTDAVYRTAEDPFGFLGIRLHHVWGGPDTDARTREQYIDIDEVYVSGVELAGVNN